MGGMGAEPELYNDFTKHLGILKAAVEDQDAFLSGTRAEAIAAVPDSLVDEVSLVGSPDRIKDRQRPGKRPARGMRWFDALEWRDVDSMRVVARTVF